ncbi:Fatty acyl-CoA reductase [Fusarium sp. LHS14.1]|nr:Fatty acyl-CoA reductase [Fusarium sp. LHS14.1]
MESKTNATVMVTGATGFLGKVVVEELLRRRADNQVQQIVLLIRKKELDAKARFEKHVATSPCFKLLPQDWVEYIQVVEGDLADFHCGLQESDYDEVCQNITHIIHTAACIKFDSEVSDAVSSNIDSACNVLAFAKDCSKLRQLVITSTAYVTPWRGGPIYEELVQLPCAASELISALKGGIIGKQQAIAYTGHPNIYSLSKCLAEHLVCETKDSVPVTIVRPSIICAALHYPMAGWIDSKAAFAGLVLGFGSGVLRVVNGRPDTKLDIVPVDVVARRLIHEAFLEGSREVKNQNARIVFSVATKERSLTLDQACRMLEQYFKETFRYIGPQGHVLDLFQFLHHFLPLHLYATINRIRGNKTKVITAKKAWRIVTGMNTVFHPYTNYSHDFQPRETMESFDPVKYMYIICAGVHENLLNSRL